MEVHSPLSVSSPTPADNDERTPNTTTLTTTASSSVSSSDYNASEEKENNIPAVPSMMIPKENEMKSKKEATKYFPVEDVCEIEEEKTCEDGRKGTLAAAAAAASSSSSISPPMPITEADNPIVLAVEEIEQEDAEAARMAKEWLVERDVEIQEKLHAALNKMESQVDETDCGLQRRKEEQEASNAHTKISPEQIEHIEGLIRQMRAAIETARKEVNEGGITSNKLVSIHEVVKLVQKLIEEANETLGSKRSSCIIS